MDTLQIRKQLHQRIDNLPDDVIEQVADFTLFVMAKKQITPLYEEWAIHQWRDFAPGSHTDLLPALITSRDYQAVPQFDEIIGEH